MVVNGINISQKMKNKYQLSIGKDIKCKKTKSCYKHLKWNIDYPFIQADAKMSYLTIRSIRNLVGLDIDFPK